MILYIITDFIENIFNLSAISNHLKSCNNIFIQLLTKKKTAIFIADLHQSSLKIFTAEAKSLILFPLSSL